jgi:hypothetical protein
MKAAEAIASYENRFTRIESDLAVVKWMLGFNLAMTVPFYGRSFPRDFFVHKTAAECRLAFFQRQRNNIPVLLIALDAP